MTKRSDSEDFFDAVDRQFGDLASEFHLRRLSQSTREHHAMAYVGNPVSVVVNRDLNDDYVTANLVASFGAEPQLIAMPYVPLQSLVKLYSPDARGSDLAAAELEPAEMEGLLRRQASALRRYGAAALGGDLTDFQRFAAERFGTGVPGLDWWANLPADLGDPQG